VNVAKSAYRELGGVVVLVIVLLGNYGSVHFNGL